MTEAERDLKFLMETGEIVPYAYDDENIEEIEMDINSPFYKTSLKEHESFGNK